MEELIDSKIQEQFPRAKAELQRYLKETDKGLKALEVKDPIDELYEMANRVMHAFEAAKPKRMNHIRSVIEELTQTIRNHCIKPVSSKSDEINYDDVRLVDSFDELAPGDIIWLKNSNDDMIEARIDSMNGSIIMWTATDTNRASGSMEKCEGVHFGEIDMKEEDVYSGESVEVTSMIEDIKCLARDTQGMRNLVHVDRQPIIFAYAQDFAKHYTTANEQAKNQMAECMQQDIDNAFGHVDRGVVRSAADRLHNEIKISYGRAVEEAEQIIAEIRFSTWIFVFFFF